MIDLIGGWGGYTLEEATALMHAEVVRKEDHSKNPPLEKRGFVAGLISLNDEIELLVKFEEKLLQLSKSDFEDKIVILSDAF